MLAFLVVDYIFDALDIPVQMAAVRYTSNIERRSQPLDSIAVCCGDLATNVAASS